MDDFVQCKHQHNGQCQDDPDINIPRWLLVHTLDRQEKLYQLDNLDPLSQCTTGWSR